MSANTETCHFLAFFSPLCLLCAALALTDIRRGIIPNGLNLSIAGLGLLKAVVAGGAMAALELGCEGAAVGLIFWLLRRCYFVWRKTQGLGLGDVKLLAAAGTWIGIAGLPTLLLCRDTRGARRRRRPAACRTGHDPPVVVAVRAVSRDRPAIGGDRATISGSYLTRRDTSRRDLRSCCRVTALTGTRWTSPLASPPPGCGNASTAAC